MDDGHGGRLSGAAASQKLNSQLRRSHSEDDDTSTLDDGRENGKVEVKRGTNFDFRFRQL